MSDNEGQIIVNSAAYILSPDRIAEPVAGFVRKAGPRMALLGQTGDILPLPEDASDEFLGYLTQVTGQNPTILKSPINPAGFHVDDLMATLDDQPLNSHTLRSYIQHHDLGAWAQERGVKMADTPAERLTDGLMDEVDSKAKFRRFMAQNGDMLPQNYIDIREEGSGSRAASEVMNEINCHGGAFIQLERAGGGIGNLDIKRQPDGSYTSGVLGDMKNEEEMLEAVGTWIENGRTLTGSNEVVSTPLMDGADFIESPTVTAYIPPAGQGEPVIYGLYGQILHPTTRAYEGFVYPQLNTESGVSVDHLNARSMAWFKHLQAEGYAGNADVDWLIANWKGQIIDTPSESNVRMNAYRFMMQMAAQMRGWELRNLSDMDPSKAPHIIANDHIKTAAQNLKAAMQALREGGIPLYGIDNEHGGAVFTKPPMMGECALGVITNDPDESRAMYQAAMTKLGGK